MYLPEDFQERAVTVEEVMRANFKDDTWPTAEVVILQMHALRGASTGIHPRLLRRFPRREYAKKYHFEK